MRRILVVGDIRLYSEGLVEILRREPDVEVIGVATCASKCLRLVAEADPHIVLVDLTMTGGLATIEAVHTHSPEAKIIALAVPDLDDEVIAAAEAGVFGYIPREASLSSLINAVRAAIDGECSCPPRIATVLMRRITDLAVSRPAARAAHRLTQRETQIVGLIDKGMSNKEIAKLLSIAVCTVKNHVHNVLEKLQLHRRQQAAAWMRSQPSGLEEPCGNEPKGSG